MIADRTVLFVCRHGAAKSVLAAAELRRLAAERGVAIAADSAGIEPDPELSPAVARLLGERDGGAGKPRRLIGSQVALAWRVIALSLDPSEIPDGARYVERWDDVPPVGDDPGPALAVLDRRIRRLLDEAGGGRSSNSPHHG